MECSPESWDPGRMVNPEILGLSIPQSQDLVVKKRPGIT